MTTVESAISDFILACQADGLSRATVEWYSVLLRRFAGVFADHMVGDLSASDVRHYLVEIDRAYANESTRSAHRRALHRFCKWCAAEYQIDNPMRNIKYPTAPTPTPRAADLSDLQAMFAAAGDDLAGHRDRAMLSFLLDTGCRAQGLITLRPGDIDLMGQRAMVTEKGSKTRAVRFTRATAITLSIWIEQRVAAPTLFYSMESLNPLTRSGLYQALRRLARRAGVKGRFNPHSLRHAFAKEYVQAGGDLATLSKLLGHRDVSTTVAHYIIFTQDELALAHEKYSPANKLKG